MPYAIILYFDHKTEEIISNIIQALEEDNLTSGILEAGFRPHITLAIYNELNCQPCDGELAKISSKTASIFLHFTYLGFFSNPEPVVFTAPVPSKELLEFHSNLHSRLANEIKEPWEFYRPGKWVPHCTLALNFRSENLPEIIRRCQSLPLPMDINAVQLGVVEFQPLKDLFKYDLLSFE